MPVPVSPLVVGARALSLEDVEQTARHARVVELAASSHALILKGRAALEEHVARGERIYGVNTGVGGNIKFTLTPDQAELLQHNIMRHLSCATGAPLPVDVVRAAILLLVPTFATGASAVRPVGVDGLLELLRRVITPFVPLYGSFSANAYPIPRSSFSPMPLR